MKKILLSVLTCIRRMKSKYYTFLFKQMLHSYVSVGVNNYCKIARTATVDVGKKFSSNGLTISGLGGGKGWRLFPLGNKL